MTILHTDEQRLTLLISERGWRQAKVLHEQAIIAEEQAIIAALDANITAIRDRKLRAEMGVTLREVRGTYEVEK